jgi:hypothetical protein
MSISEAIVRRSSIVAGLACAVVALAVPAAAQAATAVKCPGNPYSALEEDTFPTAGEIVAIGLPKKTSDYAPPCLVAQWVVGNVQRRYHANGKLPTTVSAYGARWDAGRWSCTYEQRQGEEDPYTHGTCRAKSHRSRRVTFDLGS